MEELLIGAHTSAAGGVHNALYEGKRIGATTVQLFTSNQKQWAGKPISDEQIALWKEALAETSLKKIMSHDSYLINLGSPNHEVLVKSRKAFKEEIARCEALGITYLNFHPGAALTDAREACLDRIVESLLSMKPHVKDVRLLLETTAGQGTTVGNRFEEIGTIVERVEKEIPIGVCIDTCHIFAAGYDIRTEAAWNQTLNEFEKHVGLKHLYAFHLNDSLKGLGSRVDRHQPLGQGEIGLDCFRFLMQDKRTRLLPKYLETPGGTAMWAEEIPLLRRFGEKK